MNSLIYAYNNYTGFDIPKTIDIYNVELLLAESLKMVHSSIYDKSLMFCVFTQLQDGDIIVATDDEKKILDDIISFGNYEISVLVKPESIWYTNKVMSNIIISDNIKLDSNKLSILLGMFIDRIKHKKIEHGEIKKSEVYTVFNKRNSKILMRTPVYSIAVELCDQNPCSIIKNSNNDTIYLSGHGKVLISYDKNKHTVQHKATLQKINAGIFNIKMK